jgi:hypothetical protein
LAGETNTNLADVSRLGVEVEAEVELRKSYIDGRGII